MTEPTPKEDIHAGLGRWTRHYGLNGRNSTELVHRGERLVAADPADAEGWALLGRAAHLTRNTPFAAAALERAIALGETDAGSSLYLARLFCELGEAPKAAALLQSLVARDFDGVAFTRGIVALALEDRRVALAAFIEEAERGGEFSCPAVWGAQYLASALGECAPMVAMPAEVPRRRRSTGKAERQPILAILDYKSPDLAICSANLGDYIQTAAVLRQLARFTKVDWSSSHPKLLALLEGLRARVGPGERLGGKGAARLEVLDRDVLWPVAERFGDQTIWILLYGWFFHRTFFARGPFPAPENLEAVVVSFHLASPEMLTRPVIDWLKRFEPIGCRDWTTVGWMLNQGVEAFFSGCVTTTLAGPSTAGRRRKQECLAVDVEPELTPLGAVRLTHHDESLRMSPLEAAVGQSFAMLDRYQRAGSVITSRLHCYLPCRALGTPVEFRPRRPSDVRFEGLAGLSNADFGQLSADLSRRVGETLTAILQGTPRELVRSRWREAAAPGVAAARERFGVARQGRRSRGEPRRAGLTVGRPDGRVTLALSVDPSTLRSAHVTLASVCSNTQAEVEIALLTRGLDRSQRVELAGQRRTSLFPMDDAEGPPLDRVSLARLLPDADRVVYLGPATVVQGDLARLAAHEPGEFGIAARRTPVPWLATAGQAIEEQAARLPVPQAQELRRFVTTNVDLRAHCFEPGVMVLSLDRLRGNGAISRCGRLARQFGIDEALALNLLAHGLWSDLSPAWNADPYFELFDRAELIHWSRHPPPWLADRQVLLADRWSAYEPAHPDDEMGKMITAADERIELRGPYEHRGGAAWTAVLPQDHHADQAPGGAMVLREEDRGLGPSNAMEADIRTLGGGRYAVWPEVLCFSTSDNSDPNLNARRYDLTARRAGPSHLVEPPAEARKGLECAAPRSPIGCAIIGVGQRGAAIARRLSGLQGVELRWLIDVSNERVEACRAGVGECSAQGAENPRRVFCDPRVHAVFIATPDGSHAAMAIEAFAAGKHVFLEKPLATSLADGQAIISAWKRGDRVLQLGYVLRETAFYRAVREILVGRSLGRIHTVNFSDRLGVEHGASFMRRWHRKSANSGGLMVHKGCHDLDLICWLLDSQPSKVASFGGNRTFSRPPPASHCSVCPERAVCPYEDRGAFEGRSPTQRADPARFGLDVCVFSDDKDIVDNQIVAFELATGVRGVFTLSMQNPGGSQRILAILGEDGRLEGDFEKGCFEVRTNNGAASFAWSLEAAPKGGHGGGDSAAIVGFLDACAGRGGSGLDDRGDAMRGLVFALAAEQSRNSGAVVRVKSDLSGFE